MEALANGCVEGIALDVNGYVSEGSGENIFLVVDQELITPPLGNSILPGVTRASVIQLARDLGYTVHERVVPRELLYVADEVFFTGTAAEITPIRTVDKVVVGSGRRGKLTEALLNEFFAIVKGDRPDRHGWLTRV
jgi:branched-chain amino acid aminotransferase